MPSSATDTSSSIASTPSFPPQRRGTPALASLSTSSACGTSSRCSSMELDDSTDYELVEAMPSYAQHARPQPAAFTPLPQPTHRRFLYPPTGDGSSSDSSSMTASTQKSRRAPAIDASAASSTRSAATSRATSPLVAAPATAPSVAPALNAVATDGRARLLGRGAVLAGIFLAVASGTALAHAHGLTPAFAGCAPSIAQLRRTFGHLQDGVQGFAFAYKHGVPVAIFDLQGRLMPCQAVVQTVLVAPTRAISYS